jgi:hypothetical protein
MRLVAFILVCLDPRERNHRLPHEEIAMLKELGFGALRLPTDAGGRGVSLSELLVVARDVTAADSNIAHAFRNHLWQVESALRRRDHPSERKLTLPKLHGDPFQLGHFLHGVATTFAPDAAHLDPAKRHVRFIRHRRVVDVNHARLNPQREIERLLQVVGNNAG